MVQWKKGYNTQIGGGFLTAYAFTYLIIDYINSMKKIVILLCIAVIYVCEHVL